MSSDMQGKVVIVTGAASGIGLAVALRLLADGAFVTLVDSNPDTLASAMGELPADRALGVVADVAQVADCERFVEETVARFGRLDALHNNAAMIGKVESLMTTPIEEFDRLMAVNLRGPLLGIRAALPFLKEGASIVNTASVAAIRARPKMAGYGASKAALLSLTASLAVDLAPRGIRVNAVCPGLTETPAYRTMIEQRDGAGAPRRKAPCPLGREGSPDEVANLVVWLMGPQSSYVTGAPLFVDGGLSVM